jgi:hypothetical protein
LLVTAPDAIEPTPFLPGGIVEVARVALVLAASDLTALQELIEFTHVGRQLLRAFRALVVADDPPTLSIVASACCVVSEHEGIGRWLGLEVLADVVLVDAVVRCNRDELVGRPEA